MNLLNKKFRKFPCQCGHPWTLHDWAAESIGDEFCNGYGEEYPSNIVEDYKLESHCQCELFVPDNLRYLEDCLKKKGKGK